MELEDVLMQIKYYSVVRKKAVIEYDSYCIM